jgi:hypothetical protein
MQDDILDNDDGIVDYEADGCGQASERHKIKALT